MFLWSFGFLKNTVVVFLCSKKVLLLTESMASWGCQCPCFLSYRYNTLILYLLWVPQNSHMLWVYWNIVFVRHHECSYFELARNSSAHAYCVDLLISRMCSIIPLNFTHSSSKVKFLRMSRWQQQSVRTSLGLFQAPVPMWLHRLHTCEAGLPCWQM